MGRYRATNKTYLCSWDNNIDEGFFAKLMATPIQAVLL